MPTGKKEISIATTAYSIPAEGGPLEVRFKSSLAWSASCAADWLTFMPASGDASEEEVLMKLTISENTSAKRVAEIVLSSDAGKVHVSVTQQGVDFSSLIDKKEFSVPAKGDKITITFVSPVNWTAECDQEWVKVSPKSEQASTRKKTLTITVSPNNEEKSREAYVYVQFGTEDVEIVIRQEGTASGNPDNPDQPSDPDNPDDPSDPDNPDNPSDPDDPDNPSNPDNPDEPSNPDNPDDPDSDKPDTPDNPDGQGGTEDVNKGDDVPINK